MKLDKIKSLVSEHHGIFHCVRKSGKDEISKDFKFIHKYNDPVPYVQVPNIGMLREFYSTFSNLTLYFNDDSGDAAFYIASPNEWEGLLECFHNWIEDVIEDDPEWLPYWVNSCIAVGEIPQSGNYILMPTEGEKKGHIVEFDHDGYEFTEYASNLQDFIIKILEPGSNMLTHMAAHMSFIENDPMVQWWIKEMRDNKGRVVRTEE